MARRIIRDGETVTTPIGLGDTDVLVVRDGGSLTTAAATAATLAGPTGLINNSGMIVRTGSGPAIAGSFTGALDIVVLNRAGATIDGGTRAIQFTSDAAATGTVRLVNAGTIDGNANNAIDFDSLTATKIAVINQAGGLITNSGSNDVVRPGNDLTSAISVDNAGTIIAEDADGVSENADGVDLQPQDGGVAARIVNRATGLIEGGKHGVTGANAALIVNEAGGEIIGRNGSGLNFDTDAADGDGAVKVVNAGLISGRFDGVTTGDGDGVDVDYLVDVDNSGRIEGASADNVDNFADGIAAGGGTIRNVGAGEIYGATHGILIDDGNRLGAYAATSVDNSGTITGALGTAVRLIGDFADTIVNRGTIETGGRYAIEMGGGDDEVRNGGIITGDVDLGAGDDLFRLTGGTGAVSGTIYGGEGNDRIVGADGVQRMFGGAGRDALTGGAGNDILAYSEVSDSAPAGQGDTIRDYADGDRIDLSMIDADSTTGADDGFTFVGTAAFSGAAGELRVDMSGADTVIEADVDGDGAADFGIVLLGTIDAAILSFDL